MVSRLDVSVRWQLPIWLAALAIGYGLSGSEFGSVRADESPRPARSQTSAAAPPASPEPPRPREKPADERSVPAESTEPRVPQPPVAAPLPETEHVLELVAFTLDGTDHEIPGRVLVTAQDGGVLLEDREGTIWPVTGPQLRSRKSLQTPFDYYSADELGRQMLAKLPPDFRVYQTANYVICYNTSRAYAQWCGALFERLHRAFNSYWENRSFELRKAPPLVALVFQDKQSYEAYGQPEVKDGIRSIIGYYSLRTNRIATYDLTGLGNKENGANGALMQRINQLLSDPRAERTVATLIHEATHQLAFNSGLQTRFADVPLWYNEGLAMYFETPDPKNRRGWRTVGNVNQIRLEQFRRYLANRPADSLVNLLINDQRLRAADRAEEAYAESWALCYFLIKTRKSKFIEYTEHLSKKQPLQTAAPEDRLREFQAVFGDDLAKLDAEFVRYIQRIK